MIAFSSTPGTALNLAEVRVFGLRDDQIGPESLDMELSSPFSDCGVEESGEKVCATYYPASLCNDDEDGTYCHTGNKDGVEWLKVNITHGQIGIEGVEVTNRDCHLDSHWCREAAARISNATIEVFAANNSLLWSNQFPSENLTPGQVFKFLCN